MYVSILFYTPINSFLVYYTKKFSQYHFNKFLYAPHGCGAFSLKIIAHNSGIADFKPVGPGS
jgi:hypothetical protein